VSKDDKLTIITISVVILAVVTAGAVFALYKHDQAPVSPGRSTENSSLTETKPSPPPSDKDENGCYTPDTVRKHYGEIDCVDFNVGYTYETSAGTKFIDEKQDYQNGFVIYIPSNSTFSSVDLGQFDGKQIKASGLIKEYNGYPEIEASEYSQVRIY
jgi:hypothetical protein